MKILVAGIGNIFFGDDAFGCEVASQLSRRSLPREVRVVDFGIRSYDLAYALVDNFDAAIFIDASPRGQEPGDIFLLEPEIKSLDDLESGVDAHSMNPVRVLQLARSLGELPGKLYLVGCEPESVDNEEEQLGLSETVRAAVPHAIETVERLLAHLLRENTSAMTALSDA